MTLSSGAAPSIPAASRSRLGRFGPFGLVAVGVVILLGLGIWLLVGSHSSSPAVGWQLASDSGGPAFSPVTAQGTTTVFLTTSWWPGCSPWGDLGQTTSDSSWLTPDIIYTPVAVIITLHESDLYLRTKQGPCGFYDYWGLPVAIPLSEPLGGRPLYDGSTFPPAARPYR
jgi:hypothetical protein